MQSDNSNVKADKLSLTTPDLTQELLIQLRDATPQIFSEGKIDFTKLRDALGESVDELPERYGLTWAGKREAFRNVQVQSNGTLRPQFEESVNWDTTDNLILEGDNLEILKLLQKSYHGQVKLVYIDPPYNTGNEFIYPDNFREGLDDYLRYSKQQTVMGMAASTNRETNGRYHSAWLSMMYPRLFLARNLLKEDGVIFVSIDDHEVQNLRLLMDEVFGEENFIGQIIWKSRRSEDTRAKTGLSTDHEYILTYRRSEGAFFRGVEKDVNKFSNPDNDPRGPWRSADMTGLATKEQRPNLHYDLIDPATERIFKSPPKGWRYEPSTMSKKIAEGRVLFPLDNGRPRHKLFLHEMDSLNKNLSSVITSITTGEGTKEVNELLGDGNFSFPKPSALIKLLITQITNESDNDIVLDFFAGSGTTAQAVLEANEDGGNRRFILIQLDEGTDKSKYPTIAHITRDRVRKVIHKLNRSQESQINFVPERAKQQGFRALKLDSSNFKTWKPNDSSLPMSQQLAIFVDNLEPGRTDEDRLYELVLKSGLPLETKINVIKVANSYAYSLQGGSVIICLEPRLSGEILREIFSPKLISKRPSPQLVIFLDTAFHGDDALKTNAALEAQTHNITFKTV